MDQLLVGKILAVDIFVADFLEYLGAWAEEDDEWLAIEEWQKEIGADSDGAEESERERDDDDESE